MTDEQNKSGSDRGTPVGLIAGASAVLLIVVMVLGVGWIVLRVTDTPETDGPSISYELRGERDSAGTPTEALEAARVFLKDQKKGAAEKLLARAAETWPDHQGLRFLYAETLLLLDHKAEALAQYERGISIGPDHAEYRHAAGTLAADMGRLEDAEAHYLVAQKLNPETHKHPLYLAQVQRALGKTGAARANLVLASKLNPDESIAWGTLASMALEQNRLAPARQYIGNALEVEPENTLWRLVEARIERRDNTPEKALDILLAMDKRTILQDPSIVKEIALCYGLMGEPGTAAQWYVESANANDENPELMYEAARWLERSGQTRRAIDYAHNATLLGHEGAETLLTRLEESRASADG